MRNILVDVITYNDGTMLTKEARIDVAMNALDIIYDNEVYQLIGIDNDRYQYESSNNVIKIPIDEIEQ